MVVFPAMAAAVAAGETAGVPALAAGVAAASGAVGVSPRHVGGRDGRRAHDVQLDTCNRSVVGFRQGRTTATGSASRWLDGLPAACTFQSMRDEVC